MAVPSPQSKSMSELKHRVFMTFALLAVYRIGAHITIPGINAGALRDWFASVQSTLFGMFDMFSGGGLSQLSIFALGIMPYITASIIFQLLTILVPSLKQMTKEGGAAGQQKITQYTRYSTVLITLVQGFFIAQGILGMASPNGGVPVVNPDVSRLYFVGITIATLTAGTIFLMWLGEKITDHGIGNGISLIIFAGIVAGLPKAIGNSIRVAGDLNIFVVLFAVLLMLAVLVFIIFMERGQRRIPIHYAKRMMGRKMYGGQTSYLPLRINTAGVIPPIFASSMLMFPSTWARFSNASWAHSFAEMFNPQSFLYNVVFVVLIVFFCFFYTAVVFDPKDVADNLKKQGAFVPGIRPGDKTTEYINKVLTRITMWGAIYIAAVCILPLFLMRYLNAPFYYGGTSLLIVVGVAMDTMAQFQSYLISGQFDGMMSKAKLKGRN